MRRLKKLIALILAFCVILVGCEPEDHSSFEKYTLSEEDNSSSQLESEGGEIPEFTGLNDENLCTYLEDEVYSDVVAQLNSEDYFVESVNAVYVSKEYLEEVAYNSQSNIYFGYSLEEIEQTFGSQKYIFTCDEKGNTIVTAEEEYDDSFDQVVQNVAIGTGVILICATISFVSGGLGAPAISVIFAASAKTGAEVAIESAAISAVMTATVTGIQTKDLETTLKQTALSASESFKYGALAGTVLGTLGEVINLGQATQSGLSLNEAAKIQKSTGLPTKFIQQISSMEEYEELQAIAVNGGLALDEMAAICDSTGYSVQMVKLFRNVEEGVIYYDEAGLTAETINGNMALIRQIDLTYESELAGETVTNLERMENGYAAIDSATGEAYQLHHIGQSTDSPLAILTKAEHIGEKNNKILHDVNIANGEGVHSLMSESEWAAQRSSFWKGMYELLN